MSKGRPHTHYIIERIFIDPLKWGKMDRKERYLCRDKNYEDKVQTWSWGFFHEAAVFTDYDLDELDMPICEGCEVVPRPVRLVLRKEHL